MAGQSPQLCEALYNYGLHLGNAFQLIDDALDYSSDSLTMGKNMGDDLADGKATLPLLHALTKANDVERHVIQDSLTHGKRENLDQMIDIIKRTQSLEFTKQTANEQDRLAQEQLVNLEPSLYKNALLDLAQYSIMRDH
jgi:octaprenyl-diphosphate synthase